MPEHEAPPKAPASALDRALRVFGDVRAGEGVGVLLMFLNIFIHASFNTIPLATVLLYEDSPAAVVANLALWAVVVWIKRRHDRSLETEAASA